MKEQSKRETFNIWVSQAEPFKPLYIKTTITCTWAEVEAACSIISAELPKKENIIITYDLSSNR